MRYGTSAGGIRAAMHEQEPVPETPFQLQVVEQQQQQFQQPAVAAPVQMANGSAPATSTVAATARSTSPLTVPSLQTVGTGSLPTVSAPAAAVPAIATAAATTAATATAAAAAAGSGAVVGSKRPAEAAAGSSISSTVSSTSSRGPDGKKRIRPMHVEAPDSSGSTTTTATSSAPTANGNGLGSSSSSSVLTHSMNGASQQVHTHYITETVTLALVGYNLLGVPVTSLSALTSAVLHACMCAQRTFACVRG
jgi:hypothetical protein